jgi:hypothetical protein
MALDEKMASKSKKLLIQEVLTLASSEEMVHVNLTGHNDVSSSDDCNINASFDFLFDDRIVRRCLTALKLLKIGLKDSL